MSNTEFKIKLHRFLGSNLFAVIFLTVVIASLGALAYYVTVSFQKEPDFGGMFTIRQTDISTSAAVQQEKLTKNMILEYITRRDVLENVGKMYQWKLPYKEKIRSITVDERLSSQNGYIVVVNTGDPERSEKVARALTYGFVEQYRDRWHQRNKKNISTVDLRIKKMRQDLEELMKIKAEFDQQGHIQALNTEIEMKALNDQLVEVQKQFFTAYASYIQTIGQRRDELANQLALLKAVRTDDDQQVKALSRQLDLLDKRGELLREQMVKNKPDVYKMTLHYPKLNGLPLDLEYFYENIQTLQQTRLRLMIGAMIAEKEKNLYDEQKMKSTIERLLNSNSCDVFVREVEK